jgi:hypothetical protein
MTREERKIIYWAAMFRIHEVGLCGEGLCYLINMMPEILGSKDVLIIRDLPELYKQRPKEWHDRRFWFRPGTSVKNRLLCLSKAIDLCEAN